MAWAFSIVAPLLRLLGVRRPVCGRAPRGVHGAACACGWHSALEAGGEVSR